MIDNARFNEVVDQYATSRRVNPKGTYEEDSGSMKEEPCFYTTKSGKHCIAGQICVDLGLNIPEWGGIDNYCSFRSLVKQYPELELGDNLTDDQVQFLQEAQVVADKGHQWRTAIAAARKMITL